MWGFAPSEQLERVREALRTDPASLVAAGTASMVEWDELAAVLVGHTVTLFDDTQFPRTGERWLSKREYLCALFERAEGAPQGLHALLLVKLVARLQGEITRAHAHYVRKLPSIPDLHRAQFGVTGARKLRQRCESLLADWRSYCADVEREALPQCAPLVERLARLVAHNAEAKARCDVLLGCRPGWYIDWCFCAMRGPMDVDVAPVDARVARMRDLCEADAFAPVLAEPLPYQPLPQREYPTNEALMPGAEFERLVVASIRAHYAGPLVLLDNVCLRRAKGAAPLSRRGVKQELDVALARAGVGAAAVVEVLVECKVNLRAALGDVEKLSAIMELLRSDACVLAGPCGPFVDGAPLQLAPDARVVYVGAQDDFVEGAELYARGARNTMLSERTQGWEDVLQLHGADATWRLTESFCQDPATRERVLADLRACFNLRLARFTFLKAPL